MEVIVKADNANRGKFKLKLVVCEDYDDMSRQAAEMAANCINKGLLDNGRFVLGLATGSTPVGMYSEFIRRNKAGELDFSSVITFNLDEYIGLPPEHEQSFAYFMFDNLFNHVNIKKENAHIPSGTEKDYDEYCRRYESMINDAGGVDLQVLGMGSNGHIGFNEPATTFSDITHVVELSESTIKDNSRFFEKADDVPRSAVTMGIGTIMRARKNLMLVSGANKAQALYRLMNGPKTPSMPASALQDYEDLTIFADREAASLIN